MHTNNRKMRVSREENEERYHLLEKVSVEIPTFPEHLGFGDSHESCLSRQLSLQLSVVGYDERLENVGEYCGYHRHKRPRHHACR